MDVDQTEMSEQPDKYGNNDEAGPSNSGHYDFSQAASVEMAQFREGIAQAMWETIMDTTMQIIKKIAIML